jgi:fermentation-respiration switch protein FrsA (DUF1100 family)
MNVKNSYKVFIKRPITFLSGGFRLRGMLHLPEEKNPPFVIGSHGLESSGDSPKQTSLAQKCNETGIAYFRFSHRGCGESEGDFHQDTSLESRSEDLISAYKTVMELNVTSGTAGLFGSSFGGTVCLYAAEAIRHASIVTFAAPLRSVSTGNFYFDISRKIGLIKNILVIHGESDSIVPVSDACEIIGRVMEPKKLLVQKGGDHLMSNPVHQQEFMNEAVIWFKSGLSPR